jgi:hypothetical protein
VNRLREAVFVKKPEAKVTLSNVICCRPDRVRIIMIALLNALIEYVVLPAISTSFLLTKRSNVKRV